MLKTVSNCLLLKMRGYFGNSMNKPLRYYNYLRYFQVFTQVEVKNSSDYCSWYPFFYVFYGIVKVVLHGLKATDCGTLVSHSWFYVWSPRRPALKSALGNQLWSEKPVRTLVIWKLQVFQDPELCGKFNWPDWCVTLFLLSGTACYHLVQTAKCHHMVKLAETSCQKVDTWVNLQ